MNPKKFITTHGLPILLLLIIVCLGFFKLLSPHFIVRWDIFSVQYVGLKFYADVYQQTHHLPLWSPYQYGGYPIIADPQPALFYPPHLLLVLAHAITIPSIKLLLLAHILLAGITMYTWIYSLARSRYIALFSGMSYALSSLFVAHASHLGIVEAYAWLPFLVLCIQQGIRKKSLRHTAQAGIVAALIILAGHMQSALFILLLCACIGAYQGYNAWKNDHNKKELAMRALLFAFFSSLAIGLSAIQLLPTKEFADLSTRSEITQSLVQTESFEPRSLLTLIVPNIFDGVLLNQYWGAWSASQQLLYIGIAPLCLLAIALLLVRKKSDTNLSMYTAIGIGALVFMLGKFASLQTALSLFIPYVNKLRAPANIAGIFIFAATTCAALGLERLLKLTAAEKAQSLMRLTPFHRVIWKTTLLATIGALLLFAYVIGKNGTQAAGTYLPIAYILNGLIIFALLYASTVVATKRFLTETDDLSRYKKILFSIAAIDLLALSMISPLVAGEGNSVALETPSSVQQFIATQQNPDAQNRIIVSGNLQANFYLPVSNTFTLEGYNPLVLKNYAELLNARNRGDAQFKKVMQLLNVKYAATNDPAEFIKRGWKKLSSQVLQNPDQTQEAWIPTRIERFAVKATDQERLKKALSTDPYKTAWIEDSSSTNQLPENPNAKIISAHYEADSAVLEIETDKPALLVLSENYYPGWQAQIDSAPTQIIPADINLRSVIIPAGKHSVAFFFKPRTLRQGMYITGFFLGLIAFLCGIRVMRKIHKPHE